MPTGVGKRMRQARERAGLTLDAVGKAVAKATSRETAFSPQAAQQWEKGKTEPSQEVLLAFAKLTQVNINWLLTGVVVAQVNGDSQYGTAPRGGRVIPRIAVAKALTVPIDYSADEYVHTHFACSDKAFLVPIEDSRNAPEFVPNRSQVVIDPEERPMPGDMVLARINGDPVFGKFTRRVGDPPRTEIVALNGDWHAEVLDEARGDRVVGVMTEHAKPRQR